MLTAYLLKKRFKNKVESIFSSYIDIEQRFPQKNPHEIMSILVDRRFGENSLAKDFILRDVKKSKFIDFIERIILEELMNDIYIMALLDSPKGPFYFSQILRAYIAGKNFNAYRLIENKFTKWCEDQEEKVKAEEEERQWQIQRKRVERKLEKKIKQDYKKE